MSESKSISATGDFLYLEDATIKLFENEMLLGSMQDMGKGIYFFNYHPKPGRNYRVEIDRTGFPVSVASTTVPFYTSVEYSKQLVDLEEKRYKIAIAIRDSINSNYYWYSHFSINKETGQKLSGSTYSMKTSGCIDSFNKVVEPEAEYGYWYVYLIRITDANNNGEVLKLEADYWLNKKYEAYKQILTVDEHYDKYLKTSIQMRMLENQVIALNEPVQIYSNVENGYGIFGSNVVSQYHVE